MDKAALKTAILELLKEDKETRSLVIEIIERAMIEAIKNTEITLP